VPRKSFHSRYPLLLTLRLAEGLPSLRSSASFRIVAQALKEARERLQTRIVHYSVQRDHVHLIMESEGERALSRAMKGLMVRIARGLNRHLGRRGRVWGDRYHVRILRTPKEVKFALGYVLHNVRKHARALWERWKNLLDPLSSAGCFEGSSKRAFGRSLGPKGAEAQSWLLRIGWKRHGLLDPAYLPGGP
jgi:REP element-mobilizing transposase RayT